MINHLLFADDTMFFCRADKQNCETLRLILDRYEKASGQKINPTKSSIIFSSRTPSCSRDSCKQILGIPQEGGIGKYLGLPENFGRKKRDVFASIVDRINQKVRSWSTNFLSNAGRLVLLKAVLSALPIYTMSCFKLPSSLCKRIQSLLTRFWWDGCSDKRKMSWVAWKKLAKPKALGGLGFRDIQNFNDALLGKIAWRIIRNPDSLLSRLLTSKYCVESNFMDCKLYSVTSHGWRGIMIGRDLIKRKSVYSIGNGKSVRAWEDNWIPSLPHFKPIGPTPYRDEPLMVAELMSTALQEWDGDKIRNLYPHISDHIFRLKNSKIDAVDKLFWSPTKDGEYSSKSGYFELTKIELPSTLPICASIDNFSWHSQVWNIKCSPKVRLFLWKIYHDVVPSFATLRRRGIACLDLCSHCGQEETTTHILFSCSFAQEVWRLVHWKKLWVPTCDNLFLDASRCVTQEILPPYGLSHGPLAPWLLWGLWKRRNQAFFQNRSFSPQDTFVKAIVDARDWQLAQVMKPTAPTGSHNTVTPPFPLPQLIDSIHVDASWSETLKAAGLGLVLTNSVTGRVLSFPHLAEFVYSPLVGEALAIRTAIEMAISKGLSKLQLFSDSKTCVEAILRNENHPEIYGILCDIRHLSLSFDFFAISHIVRALNTTADSVARSSLAEFAFDNNLGHVRNNV